MDFNRNGWVIVENVIHAPCGCMGTTSGLIPSPAGTYPGYGELKFSSFTDCGKPSRECVFQSYDRVHAFRTDIPTNLEVWAWFTTQQKCFTAA
jgi:hypothetical protein